MRKHRWLALALAGLVAAVLGIGTAEVMAAPSGWLSLDASIRRAAGVDWARSGGGGGTPCTNGGINVSGSGGLFNCGIFNGATTPPTPPLLINSDPTVIAAVFIVDPMSSDGTTCPSGSGKGDPTTVQGGTNDDALNSYTITTGSVPNKDELTNVYAVSHTRPDGFPELYFAAERVTNNGDSHIDFEFLQSVVTRTAACGGTFTGHRSEGDLLVAADFSNGGQAVTPSVYQWHCAPLPAPQPADGTVCDPGLGATYELVALPPGTVPFVINDTADIACGGWACRDVSGALTAVVPQFDFVEGGINLHDLGFKGCFNTFLPHTRTSNPFTAQLADFVGPRPLPSCRTPITNSSPGGTFAPGTSVHDTVNMTNAGQTPPQGTLTFFLCQPAQVTGAGCPSGTPVGSPKLLALGVATSDPTNATNAYGKYCWRTVFSPAAGFEGIYVPGSHTNATTECFNVVGASLPNTGLPDIPVAPLLPIALLVLPVTLLALPWRTVRSVALLLVAGVVVAASPAPTSSPSHVAAAVHHDDSALASPAAAHLQVGHVTAREPGWRLVIPRIGVDAQIVPVGLDRGGAMASPPNLDSVGWFNGGPAPGQPGSAVIDGHYGAAQPAVFRALRLLRPGDEIQVMWPNGRIDSFQVASKQTVPMDAHPAGLFSRSGPATLSLITCSGAWLDSKATYTDRLIVTATLT